MQPGSTANPPVITDHELLRPIGHGAYGEVWLARHERLGTLRAVKIVRRDQFEDARPFQREFDGMRRYEPISRGHPNLVAILHVGGSDDCFFYVMELADSVFGHQSQVISHRCPVIGKSVEGVATGSLNTPPLITDSLITDYSPDTLRSELKQHGALPIDRCLEIALALAGGLAHLHARGLVHRDVKPSNVIFVDGVAKLADIGLVAAVSDSRSYVGTEGYIPPEGPGAPSADCYALGKLLYELSTGHDRTAWPEPPTDLPTRPDRQHLLEFNAILHKACTPDVRVRYHDAGQMRTELTMLQAGQSVKSKRVVERRWAAGKRVAAALVAVMVLTTSLTMLWRTTQRSRYAGDGPPSTNALANALCAKALLTLRGDNYAGFAEAYTNLHRAIAADPNFARPYVGLFELRLREVVPALGPTSSEEFHSIVRNLAELAPDLGVTHCAQSMLNFFDWDFPSALEHARRSVKADPDYEVGRLCFNFILTHWGRPIEGRKEAEIARKLAPSKSTVYRSLGHTYYMQRDYTNAIALYRQAIEWQSHHTVAHYLVGRAYLALGDYLEAISYFEQKAILDGRNETEARISYDALRRAIQEGGARGYWQEEWKRTEKNVEGEYYRKAAVQIHLGDTNAAFAWLNKSYETREHYPGAFESPLSEFLFDEYWDGVRDDPRYQELLDKIGFTKVNPKLKK